jgi:hypothetical protein
MRRASEPCLTAVPFCGFAAAHGGKPPAYRQLLLFLICGYAAVRGAASNYLEYLPERQSLSAMCGGKAAPRFFRDRSHNMANRWPDRSMLG